MDAKKLYFNQNKNTIIKEIKTLQYEKKYTQGIIKTNLYAHTNDKDILDLKNALQIKQIEIQKNINTKHILNKLKKLPASKLKKNLELYTKLAKMHPKNNKYISKIKYYTKKISEIPVYGNELSMYKFALKKAIEKYPSMKVSSSYDYKVMKTAYGYAYTIYFNKAFDARKAHMLMVTLNKRCEVLNITTPISSTFYLKSIDKSCINKGTLAGDNHDITVIKCKNDFQFKASNDALSQYFTYNEVKKIKSIFNNAHKQYDSFSNKQTLYIGKSLQIWVRLYSDTKWFLVFEFYSIAPYPASPIASVWIPDSKLKEFAKLLK
jgi:hypothetical protein